MASARSSTRRLESSVALIRQESTSHDSRARDIDQRVGSIELALALQYPSEGSVQTLSYSSSIFGNRFESGARDPTLLRLHTTTQDSPSHRSSRSTSEEGWHLRKPSPDPCLFHGAPPEAYTIRTGVPNLHHSYSSEVAASHYMRIYQFGFSYHKGPREWIGFTLQITASIESRYWNFRENRTLGLNESNSHDLPASLTSMLEKSLAGFQDLKQNSCLSVFLGKDPERVKTQNGSIFPIKFSRPAFQINEYMRNITKMIYHGDDCARYPDKGFDQRPLCKHRPTNSFIVRLHTQWVRASRFGSDKSHIDRDLHILRALRQLKNTAGITPFLGVLVDDNDIVTGYLCEMPATGALCHIMGGATRSGHHIPWVRREKWCRQIIQGVAAMHSREFVVGFLGQTPDSGIGIDANDNAVLFGRFRTTFPYDTGKSRIRGIPPECKQAESAPCGIPATPETDIYQLGLLLWRIAAHKNSVSPIDFCKMAGCTTAAHAGCLEPHADPIQLPSPGEHIPQYFKDIVAECRWEQPGRRVAAKDLLKRFPPSSGSFEPSTSDRQYGSNPRVLTRPEECLDLYGEMTICDCCDEETTHHFYQCHLCELQDYDLCRRCFLKGEHCHDQNHLLQEYSELHDEEKYYTCVKENGKRDVITV